MLPLFCYRPGAGNGHAHRSLEDQVRPVPTQQPSRQAGGIGERFTQDAGKGCSASSGHGRSSSTAATSRSTSVAPHRGRHARGSRASRGGRAGRRGTSLVLAHRVRHVSPRPPSRSRTASQASAANAWGKRSGIPHSKAAPRRSWVAGRTVVVSGTVNLAPCPKASSRRAAWGVQEPSSQIGVGRSRTRSMSVGR